MSHRLDEVEFKKELSKLNKLGSKNEDYLKKNKFDHPSYTKVRDRYRYLLMIFAALLVANLIVTSKTMLTVLFPDEDILYSSSYDGKVTEIKTLKTKIENGVTKVLFSTNPNKVVIVKEGNKVKWKN